eukprot:scaffold10488_cov67-Cyclotella_meneghiniana.AAC.1
MGLYSLATIATFQSVTLCQANNSNANASPPCNHTEQDDGEKSKRRSTNNSHDNDNTIRLILRCAGCELYPTEKRVGNNNKNKNKCSPLIVALARHVPSDTFQLFAMSPYIVPCQLIRFDREGSEIKKSTSHDVPFLWSDLDAAGMVAAVESVQRADGKYFYRVEGDKADAEKYICDSSPIELAECLRLMPCVSNEPGETQDASESKKEDHNTTKMTAMIAKKKKSEPFVR